MGYFNQQDELKFYFEQRWEKKDHVTGDNIGIEFPVNSTDLVNKYVRFENELNSRWHGNVTMGAALKGDGLLTNHGIEHIKSVMHNAYLLLGNNISKLNGYEIYILLIAIHFHDLGNIFGRKEHEQNIANIMYSMGSFLPLDSVEKDIVVSIAQAHGGKFENGDKDTLRYISNDDMCNGMLLRARLLASILRFADELSDDFFRTDMEILNIPKGNEVFHLYSSCLEPIHIQGETISFRYRIPYKYTQLKVGKYNKKTYIYDEILERLTKCMNELEYCRKYSCGFLNITTFNIKISITYKDMPYKIREQISFRLILGGYPNPTYSNLDSYLDNGEQYPSDRRQILKYHTGKELKKAMKGI